MLSTVDGVFRPSADSAVDRSWMRARPSVVVRARSRSHAGQRARRVLNVLVAGTALVLLSPVMLVIALLVKLTSPGPVLYKQQRVGLDRRSGSGGNWRRRVDYGGKLFTIYKFRTMYVRQNDDQVWARPGDPRITPIGGVLRKYRLDELPQLINVLRGDMNVVGPRPEQPEIFIQLREKIDRYPERQRVLPGITGWAQVNQHYDQDLEDVKRKLTFDLEYAQKESAAEDMKIMLRTLPVMLFKSGSL
ncbi:MAG TPA: sugar transferase [Longimicrobiales bacterium]|nr:sugar transferase [Longimicrobiales bacterium]